MSSTVHPPCQYPRTRTKAWWANDGRRWEEMRQNLRYLYGRAPIPGRLEDGRGDGGHGEIRSCAVYAIPQYGRARCCQSGPCARSTGRFCAQPVQMRAARRRRCAVPLNVGEFCTAQTCEHSPPPTSRTVFQLFVRKSTVTVGIAQPPEARTFLGYHLWRILRCFRYSLSLKK